MKQHYSAALKKGLREVESDLSNEAKMMEEYTSWCDEEANTKEDAITSSKRTIGDLSATIEDAKVRRLLRRRFWHSLEP